MLYYAAPMEGFTDRVWRQTHQKWFGAQGAADRLSALIKCTEEQRSGNHEFDAALTQQRAALLAMHCPEVDWFLEHCLPCYTQNLDELTKL